MQLAWDCRRTQAKGKNAAKSGRMNLSHNPPSLEDPVELRLISATYAIQLGQPPPNLRKINQPEVGSIPLL